jgi:hypothetical protein
VFRCFSVTSVYSFSGLSRYKISMIRLRLKKRSKYPAISMQKADKKRNQLSTPGWSGFPPDTELLYQEAYAPPGLEQADPSGKISHGRDRTSWSRKFQNQNEHAHSPRSAGAGTRVGPRFVIAQVPKSNRTCALPPRCGGGREGGGRKKLFPQLKLTPHEHLISFH